MERLDAANEKVVRRIPGIESGVERQQYWRNGAVGTRVRRTKRVRLVLDCGHVVIVPFAERKRVHWRCEECHPDMIARRLAAHAEE
jgi:hypothetical protein